MENEEIKDTTFTQEGVEGEVVITDLEVIEDIEEIALGIVDEEVEEIEEEV